MGNPLNMTLSSDSSDVEEPTLPDAARSQQVLRLKGSKDSLEMTVSPDIVHDPTFESLDSGNDSELKNRMRLSPSSTFEEVFQPHDKPKTDAARLEHLGHIVYISVFAAFGSILRVYMGRFFGLDCEQSSHSAQDFMTPLSERICVTTSGKTMQTGGALFTDLPANMLGSFLMGLLSPPRLTHPLAWFRPDHPLQSHTVFHSALKTGLCGSLTTFASWNTQMVVMLDGTYTELGPQVAPALFGYLIGMACAVASFLFGRHVHGFWRLLHPTPELPSLPEVGTEGSPDPEAADEESDKKKQKRKQPLLECVFLCIGIRVSPFVLYAALLAVFVVADAREGILFYRKLWLTMLLGPCGALLRWRLAKYNASRGPWPQLAWMPWGTLAANLSAALVSVAAEVCESRYVHQGEPGYAWISSVLPAIETGFAGSLSTVSTFVKEIVDMPSPLHAHAYWIVSMVSAMLLGLAVYSPIARS